MGYPEKVKNDKTGFVEPFIMLFLAMGLCCVLAMAIGEGYIVCYFISVLIAAGMVAI